MKCYNVSVREEGGEIFFVRKVVRGKGSKSYGIQVAKLAGIPPAIIERARAVMAEIERGELTGTAAGAAMAATATATATAESRAGGTSGSGAAAAPQPATSGEGDAGVKNAETAIRELRALDLERMTPIEALNKLYELKRLLDE
ncbi:MAG: DNA mismatch repair ATPase MutS [Candidatus Alkanophagales archaeon MCA70_species_1]|nr:DNA mismatch repair ATPase MutS [Candidatus Alkanophaga volatiphilum]